MLHDASDHRFTSSWTHLLASLALVAIAILCSSGKALGGASEGAPADTVFMKMQFPDEQSPLLNGLTFAFPGSEVITASLAGAKTDVRLRDVISIEYDPKSDDYVMTLAGGKTAHVGITRMAQNNVRAHLFGVPIGVLLGNNIASKHIHFLSMTATTAPDARPEIAVPPNQGFFVRTVDRHGNRSARMMIGQSDSKGAYTPGRYGDFANHRNGTDCGSGPIADVFYMRSAFVSMGVPVYLIESLTMTSDANRKDATVVWRFRNQQSVTCHGTERFLHSVKELYGLVDGGLYASSDATEWRTVQMEWDNPIPTPGNKNNGHIDIHVTLGLGLPVRLERPALLRKNGGASYSFSLPGLQVDSEASKFVDKELVMNVKSGTSTLTFDKQNFSGKIASELAAIAGYAHVDGMSLFSVFPLSAIEQARICSSLPRPLGAKPLGDEQWKHGSQRFTVEDVAGRDWHIKDMRGAFTGLTYESPPPGYRWTQGAPIIKGGHVSGTVAIDWKGATVHIPIALVQDIDVGKRTVSFRQPILKSDVHRLLGFGCKQLSFSNTIKPDVDDVLLRDAEKWASMAVSGFQEDGSFLLFPIGNVRRIAQSPHVAIPETIANDGRPATGAESGVTLKVTTKNGMIELKNASTMVSSLNLYNSSDRVGLSYQELLKHRDGADDSNQIKNEVGLQLSKGPLVVLNLARITRAQTENGHLRVTTADGLDFVGHCLNQTIFGQGPLGTASVSFDDVRTIAR